MVVRKFSFFINGEYIPIKIYKENRKAEFKVKSGTQISYYRMNPDSERPEYFDGVQFPAEMSEKIIILIDQYFGKTTTWPSKYASEKVQNDK